MFCILHDQGRLQRQAKRSIVDYLEALLAERGEVSACALCASVADYSSLVPASLPSLKSSKPGWELRIIVNALSASGAKPLDQSGNHRSEFCR
jgi:hypothetical protein